MDTSVFPDDIFGNIDQSVSKPNIFFYDYLAGSKSTKNKVIFRKHIFNFILSGNKTIHTLGKSFHLNHSQSMIIRKGNCLTSEQFSENESFNSLTLYFDSETIQNFFVKFSKYLSTFKREQSCIDNDVFIFEKDVFIENYIDSVKQLLQKNNPITDELTQLKFDEIMLYLLQKQGIPFFLFIDNLTENTKDVDFRIKMENESLNILTVEEMAFLCNMSLSTFKRNFLNTYGVPPQKWFQNKRLQFAYDAIISKTKTPSDLYLKLGYNSLSSFSVAFTKLFGVPPTKIQ